MTNFTKIGKKSAVYKHVLILMRHGKAEGMNEQGDQYRQLTDKGLKQSKKMGKAIADMGLVPDIIASSAATRARQTTERLLATFGDGPDVRYHMDLYDHGMQAIMDELAHTKDKHRVLMVVCHEPTVSYAAQWLASPESDPVLLGELALGFAPSSIAVLASDDPFAQWQTKSGLLVATVSPKEVD